MLVLLLSQKYQQFRQRIFYLIRSISAQEKVHWIPHFQVTQVKILGYVHR